MLGEVGVLSLRFYFVGDEDLLEMIGNSRDVGSVMRHMARRALASSALSSAVGCAVGFGIPFHTLPIGVLIYYG